MIASLGSGDDGAEFRAAVIDGDVRVRAGGGADRVDFSGASLNYTTVGDARVRGDFALHAGGGADDIFVNAARFDGEALVEGGSGGDRVFLVDARFRDGLTVRGGRGADEVVPRDVFAAGGVRLLGNGGRDVLRNVPADRPAEPADLDGNEDPAAETDDLIRFPDACPKPTVRSFAGFPRQG